MEKFKTILLACLTVLMLTAAGIYIGGSQFPHTGAAASRTALPDGAVRAGADAPAVRTLADAGLLAPAAAIISAAGETAGAFAGDIPDTVTALAYPLIHQALAADATLTATDFATMTAAAADDCIYLQFAGTLPYQLLYALTGDIEKAAAADRAVSADTLLLAFDEEGAGRLYLTDGSTCAVSDKPVPVRAGALAALIGSDALTAAYLADNLVPVGETSMIAAPIAVEDGTLHPLSADTGRALLSLFAFNPDRHRLSAQAIVEPHGSLSVTTARIAFTASRDGGIPITTFLEGKKNALDIGIYDILTAAAAFADRLRDMDGASFGGAATPFLQSFYKDGDGYTVTFGLRYGGIPLGGDAIPSFLSLTASGGIFTAAEVRRLSVSRAGAGLTLFPAAWQYATAAKNACEGGLHSLKLFYAVDALPIAACDAAWYCDRAPYTSAGAAVLMTYAAPAETESGAVK